VFTNNTISDITVAMNDQRWEMGDTPTEEWQEPPDLHYERKVSRRRKVGLGGFAVLFAAVGGFEAVDGDVKKGVVTGVVSLVAALGAYGVHRDQPGSV
jgi:hypothetical protein